MVCTKIQNSMKCGYKVICKNATHAFLYVLSVCINSNILKRLNALAPGYWRTRLTLGFLTHLGKTYYILWFDKVPEL